MALLSVDSTPIKTPSAYRVRLQDLDTANSVRNESGVLTRERVRAGVYKLECEWQGIYQSELDDVIAAIAPVSFSVTFFDATTGSTHTATMYSGDRDAELLKYDESGDSLWRFKVNLIEY